MGSVITQLGSVITQLGSVITHLNSNSTPESGDITWLILVKNMHHFDLCYQHERLFNFIATANMIKLRQTAHWKAKHSQKSQQRRNRK